MEVLYAIVITLCLSTSANVGDDVGCWSIQSAPKFVAKETCELAAREFGVAIELTQRFIADAKCVDNRAS